LEAFKAANNGSEPSDLSQLQPYLTTPKEKAALESWFKLEMKNSKKGDRKS